MQRSIFSRANFEIFRVELFLLLPNTSSEEKFATEAFAEEPFVKFIFAIYELICVNVFCKNKENATFYVKLYIFQRKHTRTGHDSLKIYFANISSLKVRNLYVKYVNGGITIFYKINRRCTVIEAESIFSIPILPSNC